TVEPYQDRTTRGHWVRAPDRQREAILTLRPLEVAHDVREARTVLRGDRSVGGGVANAVPRRRGLGRCEARRLFGPCRIWHVAEDHVSLAALAAKRPLFRAN